MTPRQRHIARRLADLPRAALQGLRRGIEKESLRVDPMGTLASTPHPPSLGSPLTHPRITTDFCESQVEMITGAHATIDSCLTELRHLHQFVQRSIGTESLWASSMPCELPADADIPIARYGSSNPGRLKSVYRTGLGHRYGRRMQTISGIHYNWSMPDLTSDDHFRLIRNFRRQAFMLLYLFGASPAVCDSFVAGREHGLQALAPRTFGLPHATSLRMGRLGYQSEAQSGLRVRYDHLEDYAQALQAALTVAHADYEAMGLRGPGGEYTQLATTLLQTESEFYSTIRPKCVTEPNERPLHALRARGVEYLEVRCLDLDPFVPEGIAGSTMAFLDVFLLHCLLAPDWPDSPEESQALVRNQELTAMRGREPGLRLERGGAQALLVDWVDELLTELSPIASALDSAGGGARHQDAVHRARAALSDPQSLPSARVLAAMGGGFGGGFARCVLARSEAIKRAHLEAPWPAEMDRIHREEATASLHGQRRIEDGESLSFEAFRQWYLDPVRLEPGAHSAAGAIAA